MGGSTSVAASELINTGGCFTNSLPALGVLSVVDKTGHDDTG